MNYKLWGMYTSVSKKQEWNNVLIITDIKSDCIFGIIIVCGPGPICNAYINDWFRRNIGRLNKNNVLKIDIKEYPDVLNEIDNMGYIGRVEKLEIRRKLGKIVEEMPENKC